MEIILIAAIAEKGVIGNKGSIPWKSLNDLQRFKELTQNHTVIMGRYTWESLPIKPLRKRFNIVLSSQTIVGPDKVFSSVDEVITFLQEAKNAKTDKNSNPEASFRHEKVFVIGGQAVYESFMPFATHLEITRINGNYLGDRFFPSVDWSKWELISEQVFEDGVFCSYIFDVE